MLCGLREEPGPHFTSAESSKPPDVVADMQVGNLCMMPLFTGCVCRNLCLPTARFMEMSYFQQDLRD